MAFGNEFERGRHQLQGGARHSTTVIEDTDRVAFGSSKLAPGAVLLLGGRSEIGLEVADRLAPGRVVILAARRSDDLAKETQRLLDRGATEVHCVEFDADEVAGHEAVLSAITAGYGPIGIAILAFGILGNQDKAEQDAAHAVAVVHTDFVAQLSALTTLTNLLRAQGDGQIVVFSSIAGVRVRRANYVYGSAKAGLDGFANGLADALVGSGVHLLLVRPGFVIGKMTEGMSPAPFPVTPDQVGDAVVHGLQRRSRSVWVPKVLQPLSYAMRLTPRAVWRRMPR
ncbi:SDR family NAD(P)-dependent oxidoreductase [Nocardiaceae bacterium YC2-7]|uniref:SDR family NAD(P)-dependent oxidoreductase n=1 Tax=Antrihabitans stalactiti TaxID=2584121 RepID=A0A848KLK9_9NOCA|nr:SDR family NAD(P)-dependent oxidoreductase [Antrihabitans stalactiti]NMN98726.1 SDR family NAD(P)-dependent oxidoreductase [Antrihabitans stalactiti]